MDVHETKRSGFAAFVSSSRLSIFASLAHTEEFFKKTKRSCRVLPSISGVVVTQFSQVSHAETMLLMLLV